ncbi:unnamed protein product, partial [marine sediment metagenome]
LTFLSKKDIIITPFDGIDRYPKYTNFVNSLDKVSYIDSVYRYNEERMWKILDKDSYKIIESTTLGNRVPEHIDFREKKIIILKKK